MKELVVISGKGGTGKTSLAAAFAALAGNHLLCDTDVDAADLHLLLQPQVVECHDFVGGSKARINPDRCSGCGTCAELCHFQAIRPAGPIYEVEQLDCEGCGVCRAFCPEQAIDFRPRTCGQWFVSDTRFGPMVHARLGIGEENSGKLVSVIRRRARELAEARGLDLIITDGPPGIGCPVIASITGASAVLIVVEPTLSGKHDMERVAELAAHFRIPAMVCINKYDLNQEMSGRIEAECGRRGLARVGRIPFDPAFTRAMVEGRTVPEYAPGSALARNVEKIWESVRSQEFSKEKTAVILPMSK